MIAIIPFLLRAATAPLLLMPPPVLLLLLPPLPLSPPPPPPLCSPSDKVCDAQMQVAPEMQGLADKDRLSCYERDEEDGGFTSSCPQFNWDYKTAKELEENDYTTLRVGKYSGAGYVLQNTSALLQREPTKHMQGSELYQYAHSRLDVSDLLSDCNWLSPSTRECVFGLLQLLGVLGVVWRGVLLCK